MPGLKVPSLNPRTAAIAAALAGALMLAASPGASQTPPPRKDDFQISAPYAILIEADSGTVLFEKNADKLNPPASMSKLMTTELVLHTIAQGKLKWDDELTIRENAWRKGGAPSRRLGDVRGAQQPGQRQGPDARRDDPVGQRRLHRVCRRHRGQRACLRRPDEQARARDRADAIALHQFDRAARRRARHDHARARQARAAHHQDLSGGLQDLRRARVHLEQGAPAEPQSAARHEHRRRRAEDRLHQGSRLRPDRRRR